MDRQTDFTRRILLLMHSLSLLSKSKKSKTEDNRLEMKSLESNDRIPTSYNTSIPSPDLRLDQLNPHWNTQLQINMFVVSKELIGIVLFD